MRRIEPGAGRLPGATRAISSSDSPRTRLRVAISTTLPRQASCLRASCVVPDNRFSFPTMRSTTLSV